MNQAAAPSLRTAADHIAWAISQLEAVTETARLEAELLLAEMAGVGRAAVIAHPERKLNAGQAACFEAAVARRRSGEPLAYIVGRREFYSLDLSVRSDVLVPRPETEALVDAALARLPMNAASVVDLGTGSGAIALALKHLRPALDITAVDCEEAALDVARANARTLGVDVNWLRSDWFSALEGFRFDLIVSNPPYVASGDPHFDGALAHEPRIALDGGVDGLDAYRAVFRDVSTHLAPGGWLVFEHGFDQREAVCELARAAGFELEAGIDDLAGLPRVACFSETAL
jgi:release factor glutamine methyltransferase